MRRGTLFFLVFLLSFMGGCWVIVGTVVKSIRDESEPKVAKNSILHLQLEGIILKPDRFLKNLRKYAKMDQVRAVVIEINSPGGVVGPSQAIYDEILRTRTKLEKPVVVTCSAVTASGAYYAAVAADKIITQPGTMMGSIGVIMEFANLEKLYDWAKIKRYSITTGKYKDSGAEYRPMRTDEQELFQDLVDDVHRQFKEAVADGRKMKMALVESYADGRILTGRQAVELGFADRLGDLQDAIDEAVNLAGIEGEPELFEPPSQRPSLLDLLGGMAEENEAEGSLHGLHRLLKGELVGKPLFMMPGTWDMDLVQ